MNRSIQIFAYIVFAFALTFAVGVYFASSSVRQSAVALSATALNAQAQQDRLAYQKRISALAKDTQEERAAVESLVSFDIVSIVNKIEAAGKPLGLTVTVNDAQASGAQQDLANGDSLRAVTFLVQSEGSYASLMKLETMFENLPLASSVESVELQKLQDPKTPWHLTARIRVYTTAAISS